MIGSVVKEFSTILGREKAETRDRGHRQAPAGTGEIDTAVDQGRRRILGKIAIHRLILARQRSGDLYIQRDAEEEIEGKGDRQRCRNADGRIRLGQRKTHGRGRSNVRGTRRQGHEQRTPTLRKPEQTGGCRAQHGAEQGHTDPGQNQEQATSTQLTKSTGRHQPHLKQKKTQRAFEQIHEQRLEWRFALWTGDYADGNAADQ